MNKASTKTKTKNRQTPAHHLERRTGSRGTVQKLMDERTEMLVLFGRLAGLDAAKQGRRHAPAAELLQEFCQVMVDYLAAGHFELYERLVNGTERRRELAALAEQIYPKIADTTQAALDFNDKYDGKNGMELSMAFDDDLNRLGEVLASRIELEDRLLKLFH